MEVKYIRSVEDLNDEIFIKAYESVDPHRYETALLINSNVSFIDTIMLLGITLSESLLMFTMKDPKRVFSVKESNGKYTISMDDPVHTFNYRELNQDEALKKLSVLKRRQAI